MSDAELLRWVKKNRKRLAEALYLASEWDGSLANSMCGDPIYKPSRKQLTERKRHKDSCARFLKMRHQLIKLTTPPSA